MLCGLAVLKRISRTAAGSTGNVSTAISPSNQPLGNVAGILQIVSGGRTRVEMSVAERNFSTNPPSRPRLILATITMPAGCSVHLGVVAIVSLLFRGEGGSGSPPDARPPARLSKDTGSVCVPVVERPIPKSCGKHTEEFYRG